MQHSDLVGDDEPGAADRVAASAERALAGNLAKVGDKLEKQGKLFVRDRLDLLLLYTDGLAEARAGDDQFGEERIGNVVRRDPGIAPDVLCKTLLEAAKDFATRPLDDDVAILAIRRL